MPTWFIARLNLKSFCIALSFLLVCFGVLMIFLGIEDAGSVNLAFTGGEGEIRSGFVGVTLIFLGVFLSLFALLSKAPSHSIKIENADIKLEWTGNVHSFEEALASIKKVVDGLSSQPESGASKSSGD